MKRRICIGDTVHILAGNDKGKEGKVLSFCKDRVVVEGVNVRTKNIKRSQENPKGKRISIETPIHISNVRLSIDGEPARLFVKASEKGRELWQRCSDGSTKLYRLVKERKG
ncbi:50S ribosomal protein L24 [Chlamydia pecorum]|uniref:Large ribosomal subunit protein uL24 n=2 Tax=Chlamydia pecorum TaxID=85991 RepID=A0AA34RCT9_CHLPE|nr:50S ribosomal protein L24 [Chlamydia pecorum]AEB41407.1 ribosomal protein L24 [Chlamydia pecorum E58]AGW37613.1 50S ribosomal protein L24 [Chlamydia pecorum PV3056/3]AGW38534.1 50S ribosomal protein L24 [Chlamydia pecorum W73]AGW39459.1 50S ribosomal protein L24 [Chlamydia pecorum P787]ETF38756.1 50S ribosomal protein L24 [Chlamydia pecorum VR629]